jgi:hypothetical protein
VLLRYSTCPARYCRSVAVPVTPLALLLESVIYVKEKPLRARGAASNPPFAEGSVIARAGYGTEWWLARRRRWV